MTVLASRQPAQRRTKQRGAGRVKKWALIGPAFVYYSIFFWAPALLLLTYVFLTPGRFGGVTWEFSLASFQKLADPLWAGILSNSVFLALGATLVALLLGVPAAYAISRIPNQRWKIVALVLVVIPFWTSFLIRLYAWLFLLNTQGPLNGLLVDSGILATPLEWLYTEPLVIVVMAYTYLPLMILPVYASLEKIDSDVVEVAADLGAGPVTRLWRVVVPIAVPGMVMGSILIFVPSLGNFLVPDLIGGGKYPMVGSVIRDQFLLAKDWPFASLLVMILVVFLVALFSLQSWLARRTAGEFR